MLRVFLHGIDMEELTDALDSMKLTHALNVCKDVRSADAIMVLRGHVRRVRACFEVALLRVPNLLSHDAFMTGAMGMMT